MQSEEGTSAPTTGLDKHIIPPRAGCEPLAAAPVRIPWFFGKAARGSAVKRRQSSSLEASLRRGESCKEAAAGHVMSPCHFTTPGSANLYCHVHKIPSRSIKIPSFIQERTPKQLPKSMSALFFFSATDVLV